MVSYMSSNLNSCFSKLFFPHVRFLRIFAASLCGARNLELDLASSAPAERREYEVPLTKDCSKLLKMGALKAAGLGGYYRSLRRQRAG